MDCCLFEMMHRNLLAWNKLRLVILPAIHCLQISESMCLVKVIRVTKFSYLLLDFAHPGTAGHLNVTAVSCLVPV